MRYIPSIVEIDSLWKLNCVQEHFVALLMFVNDLQFPQFRTLFNVISLSKSSFSTNHFSIRLSRLHRSFDPIEEPRSKTEILFRSYWRRAWIVLLWLIICSALFAWKFTQYRHRAAFQVMGYCVSTAKGAAETLKFNMALILLPVCRNTITWLRKNRSINSIIPFNDNINFHKVSWILAWF